ncbi:hypothetical protein AXF42_Ash017044 [Apostasia shenzhenica]|uniref:Uncharacterized protein n=1 Tax=Apostasia shenzhenica TaxID=1088818 RepID=A0A2I0B7K1_9ASPA|nr:hypothetical protein AXF42_Ash017044 [Apostasia shenzhenica]
MVGHGHQIPLEVVGTMIEMADVAWNALEHRREQKAVAKEEEEEIHRLRCENHHLSELLAENLSLLHGISSHAPSLANDCPPDLYERLLAVVDTPNFLATLESINREIESRSLGGLLHAEDSDQDLPLSINIDEVDPNLWVLVTHDMAPVGLEEESGIDNEHYILISEENVVDGVANFIARSILENPKAKIMSPEELQNAVTKAVDDIRMGSKLKSVWEAGKVIYALSTWGIFLAGLYRHREIVKATAKGVNASTKFVLKAF